MEFKSYSEAARKILNCSYYNSKVKEKLLLFCKDNNIDLKIVKEKKNFCLECGREIASNKKFCDSSCAAKYNNKHRIVTETQKEKTRQTMKQKYLDTHNGIEYKRKHYEKTCQVCGKEFMGTKNQIFCSRECVYKSSVVKQKISDKAKKRIEKGTFSGWKTRNIKSYAEIFWEKVLQENSIPYTHESFETKKYFLDFLIVKNDRKIDLEIDGKQHRYRKQHDKERDEYLKKLGYEVYRVSWNEINTDEGKNKMKKKIEDFLQFLNTR